MLMKLNHLVVERFIISTILLTRLHKICTNHVTCEAGHRNVIYNKDSVSMATGGIIKRAGFSLNVQFSLFILGERNKSSP